ncbi:MAG: OmpA family protein [Luteolibacter sp.]
MKKPLLMLSLVGLSHFSALAIPSADTPGTKDYPGLPRYEGSRIISQSEEKFASFELQIAGLSSPASKDPKEIRIVEGATHRTTYALGQQDGNRTALEVFRNYEQALADASFTTIWTGKDRDLRNGPPRDTYFPEPTLRQLLLGSESRAYLCAEKGGLYAALYVTKGGWKRELKKNSPANKTGADIDLPIGTILIQLDLIETKPMEEKMVLVKAEEMENRISSAGRVALYGIHFDFNKADIKPESEPTLSEIVKLLKDSPSLKLLVVGHTDNVGTFDFNRDLSQRRAAAVVKELTAKHGIDPDRLTPHGASYISPVATNKTEEGKALNRRVELVEQ